MDAAGGCIEDVYTSTGSGSPYVYGVLEDNFVKNIDTNKGADLAIRAINVAMKRDSASGNGVDVVIIKKDGFTILTEDQVNKRMKKMKID